MKILIKGYYGFGNLGDDILMIITYNLLREKYPRAVFYVFSNFNENLKGFDRTKGYNRYIHQLLGTDPEIVDWTYRGHFDLLVDGGGGVYFDSTGGSLAGRMRNALLRLAGIDLVCRIDRVLRVILRKRKKLTFARRIGIGLGIGPYRSGSHLLYDHLTEIGSCDGLIVRDESSFAFLERYRFPGKKFLLTDTAFIDRHWMPQNTSVEVDREFRGNIGVVLMDRGEESADLFSTFEAFASECRQQGYSVTFFSFDENFDRRYLQFFSTYQPFQTWSPPKSTIEQFLRTLAAQDVLITARAHGAILGGQLGVVPVCLGQTQKLREVARMFSSSALLIEGRPDREKLHACVENVRQNYRQFLTRLAQDNALNRKKAAEAVRVLNQLYES